MKIAVLNFSESAYESKYKPSIVNNNSTIEISTSYMIHKWEWKDHNLKINYDHREIVINIKDITQKVLANEHITIVKDNYHIVVKNMSIIVYYDNIVVWSYNNKFLITNQYIKLEHIKRIYLFEIFKYPCTSAKNIECATFNKSMFHLEMEKYMLECIDKLAKQVKNGYVMVCLILDSNDISKIVLSLQEDVTYLKRGTESEINYKFYNKYYRVPL